MFKRVHIGMSWSPDALTAAIVVDRRCSGLVRRPLPKGSIDVLSGRVLNKEALRSAIRSLPGFGRFRPGIASVSLAIPSSAAYLQTWVENDRPRVYAQDELKRRVEMLFPGKFDQLLFDTHQSWIAPQRSTRVMLVVVNRELLEDYINLLGVKSCVLVRTTTAEIARYNLYCQKNPGELCAPAAVVSANQEYIEVTGWSEGAIRCGQRVLVSSQEGGASEGISKNGGTDGAEQQTSAYALALDQTLSSVISRFPTAEQARCRIVICHGAAEALVQRIARSLGMNPVLVDVSQVVDSSRIPHRGAQTLCAGITQEKCDGMADALGALFFAGSDQARIEGRATTVFGGLGSLCTLPEWRGLQAPWSADSELL